MNSLVRQIRAYTSNADPTSKSEGLAKTDRPAPRSTLGLRIVNPHLVDALIDVVFIHGLTGDRESTWTAKGAASAWPESLLPNDLPQARIIMYGYDADVVNFWSMASQNTIGDHSQKFLTSLANLRDSTNTSTRPLAFIAHSMGGIVCQDALLKSRGSADQHTQRILEKTRGIVFMGTPHCGSGLTEWAIVGSKLLQCFRRLNQSNLEVLQQKSEVMARIRQDFHTMLRGWTQRKKTEIVIVCFYEELPVRAVGEIVPKDSATLDGYTSIGIHANHMKMTKLLSDQDPDYRNVVSELQRFIQPCEQLGERPSAFSASPTSPAHQGQYHSKLQNEGSVPGQDLSNVHERDHPCRPTKIVNTFSGTFNTGGGKMFQGGDFNSGGGSMNF